MRGVKLGLEAIALSIISLGLVDAVAFLPLSISATATSSSSFRCAADPRRALRCRRLRHPRRRPASRAAAVRRPPGAPVDGSPARGRPPAAERRATRSLAWFFLLGCWTTRALGSTLLLAALGVGFSPTLALVVLCLSAAASLIPIASGGAVANVGATAAVLLALGVHSEQAINFGLASGLLLCGTAAAAGDRRPGGLGRHRASRPRLAAV